MPKFPLALALLLGVATAAVFWPCVHNDFLSYDDPEYVLKNPVVRGGLTHAGVLRSFSEAPASNWHPVTWISHMADVELFGMQPRGHHAVSVLLHAANAGLLLLLLAGGTGAVWPSLAAAALFALHPLRVESVAWVAERKDLLAAFFSLLTCAAYLRYVRRPGAPRYAAVVATLVLALLSKPMAVSLPLLLLIVDVWPLGRLRSPGHPGRLLLEKAPLALLAGAVALIAFLVQRSSGAVKGPGFLLLPWRLANAATALGGYLAKTVWPQDLSVIYPHPGPTVSLPSVALSALALALLAVIAWRTWRSRPYLAAGLAWYLAAVLPVLGIVQVGWQSMADRYTYLPLLGPVVAAVWLAADQARRRRWPPIPLAAVVILASLLLAGAARSRIADWRTSESLFRQALRVTENHWIPALLLGLHLQEGANLPEAVSLFQDVVRRKPDLLPARWALGRALLQMGRREEAVAVYRAAVDQAPGSIEARVRLAGLLALEPGDPAAVGSTPR